MGRIQREERVIIISVNYWMNGPKQGTVRTQVVGGIVISEIHRLELHFLDSIHSAIITRIAAKRRTRGRVILGIHH